MSDLRTGYWVGQLLRWHNDQRSGRPDDAIEAQRIVRGIQADAAPAVPSLTVERLEAVLKANIECTSNGPWYDVRAILAALATPEGTEPRSASSEGQDR